MTMVLSVGDETHEFDPDKFLNVELMAVERLIGMTAGEFQDALNRSSMTAITALLWLLRKRKGDVAPFESIEFETGSFSLEDKVAEPDVPLASDSPAETSPTTNDVSSNSFTDSVSVPGNVTG